MVYRHSNLDVFFIDWEQSKELTAVRPAATLPPSASPAAQKTPSTGRKSVSVWRTIFVANEYCKLAIRRRVNLNFTLFFLGLILIGLSYQYDATQQPSLHSSATSASSSPSSTSSSTSSSSTSSEYSDINIILRFAESMFWFLLLSGGQVLFKFVFYERYVAELPEQLFMDVCTLAKISVIVMDEKSHGYYLHCRSPHQYADGTMNEIQEMLAREEGGLTVDRGLYI